jgi:uncharacterized membrane protein YheB (UPF0754 family)
VTATWIMLPVVGMLIGYATNWLAIRMLFRPRRRILGYQGLLPRRQADIAHDLGHVIGDELVRAEHLLQPLQEIDLRRHLAPTIERALAAKIDQLKALPLIGALITPERIGSIREAILDAVMAHEDEIKEGLLKAATEHLDIAAAAERELARFDLDRLERTVKRICATELRAIEIWGGILGLAIGLVQAALLTFCISA